MIDPARLDNYRFRYRICRYKCGTCGHESVDLWWNHQTHYERHQDEKLGY